MFENGVRLPLYLDETDTEIILTADVPIGLPKERLTLSYESEWLRVNGEWQNIEYTAGCVIRNVDASKADTTIRNGLLTIRLPKTRNSVRINIKV